MIKRINSIRNNVKEKSPLIHCITNPISINQCANAVLSSGARPIMAEHPEEVSEITQTAQALLLNMGNITDARMQSILISARTAKEYKLPSVLDVVGVACSTLRKSFAYDVLKINIPAVIKGNYSEINAIYNGEYKSTGVDADKSLSEEYISEISLKLSQKYGCTVLASGKADIIAGNGKIVRILNGTPELAKITGTGCMLGALTACFLSEGSGIEACSASCTVLGISGEKASVNHGSGSFEVSLFDNLSTLSDTDIERNLKME